MSAHLALAEATDPQIDPDRRAWHHAQATPGPDAHVAAELERSADRARPAAGGCRGGVPRAGGRAHSRRARSWRARALAAAEAKLDAGAPDSADQLAAAAGGSPLNDLERARLERLRAQLFRER